MPNCLNPIVTDTQASVIQIANMGLEQSALVAENMLGKAPRMSARHVQPNAVLKRPGIRRATAASVTGMVI